MQNVYWGISGAIAYNANASILMIGDSWFWYPLDNLAVELGAIYPNDCFAVAGYTGAEAQQWSEKFRKDIDFAFKMYGSGVRALMLSGGGNDIAGMSDFLRLLKDDCSKEKNADGCFREGQPYAVMEKIIGAYKEVIRRFRAHNNTAPVVMHNYDYAFPSGKGIFGPAQWLKAPFEKAKVPENLRKELFQSLISRLNVAQVGLSKDKTLGPLVAVRTAGTLPDDTSWWANELHPTPAGFKRLATAFKKSLKPVI
jgi:lysophospholipase L1-like esterase